MGGQISLVSSDWNLATYITTRKLGTYFYLFSNLVHTITLEGGTIIHTWQSRQLACTWPTGTQLYQQQSYVRARDSGQDWEPPHTHFFSFRSTPSSCQLTGSKPAEKSCLPTSLPLFPSCWTGSLSLNKFQLKLFQGPLRWALLCFLLAGAKIWNNCYFFSVSDTILGSILLTMAFPGSSTMVSGTKQALKCLLNEQPGFVYLIFTRWLGTG